MNERVAATERSPEQPNCERSKVRGGGGVSRHSRLPAPAPSTRSIADERKSGGNGGRGTYRRRPLSIAKRKAAVGSPTIPSPFYIYRYNAILPPWYEKNQSK